MTSTTVRAGFIPLLDAAPLIVAARMGFAEAEGVALELMREMSWATLRDRLAVRHLDAAHLLAPMPIAANLGLGPMPIELIAPISLGFAGNTITVSRALWSELQPFQPPADFDPRAAAISIARLVEQRRSEGRPPLCFAIVHPYSVHHYMLAYWIAAAGLDPGRDVDLVVVPPPLMADALAAGHIDGFCVGEPWGSVAADRGAGIILTTSADIWRACPDKVLGVRADWAATNAPVLASLIRAVYKAAVWCDDQANRGKLAALLARVDLLDRPEHDILPGLSRTLTGPGGTTTIVDGFLTFADRAASFPSRSKALWLYSQMVRWGQVSDAPASRGLARATYRPDLYRAALAPLAVPLPAGDASIEGCLPEAVSVRTPNGPLTLGPDTFFDGRTFDPDDVAGYIAGRGAFSGEVEAGSS